MSSLLDNPCSMKLTSDLHGANVGSAKIYFRHALDSIYLCKECNGFLQYFACNCSNLLTSKIWKRCDNSKGFSKCVVLFGIPDKTPKCESHFHEKVIYPVSGFFH